MAKSAVIRHPLEWTASRLGALGGPGTTAGPAFARPAVLPPPAIIGTTDLRSALRAGLDDFLAFRSDVIVLCIMYPLAGSVLWRFATGMDLLQLVFPLVAGFALVGPLFATGLYEMSRQRESGRDISWGAAFDAFRSPNIGAIFGLGFVLMTILAAWLFAAQGIYASTVAHEHPASVNEFINDVLFTGPGVAMMIGGFAAGFAFAAVVLCISLISFPLLLDRHVSLEQAVAASIAAARANPQTVAVWGVIVAAGLAIGAAPALIGLIVTMPILGHATWHLYRRLLPG
jgi:uncharacterized membrane protein